ncbi:MAG: hypothetical protein GF365_04745 [Candidatus Buchananbacteria bacterium]|nr:hypothetical protein [Candidatus Buchananbacteria bacterium]
MCQTESGKAKKEGKQTGQEFTLRESLLADILPAIETAAASDSFGETLSDELKANADLHTKIIAYRNNSLISQRKILNSLPPKARSTVSEFIRDLLTTGKIS